VLAVSDADKKVLAEAWSKYRTDNVEPDQHTPAAILRLMLAAIEEKYKDSRAANECILGQCNCGAAFQLSEADRALGVKIVYAYTANNDADSAQFNNAEHDYAKDFAIKAVYVDVAHLQQTLTDKGTCTIKKYNRTYSPSFKNVTLVDMLAATHMRDSIAVNTTTTYRVGDGVGFMTAPPSQIPTSWRYGDTARDGLRLWAGCVTGTGNEAMWPFRKESREKHTPTACEKILGRIAKIESENDEECVDLLADEAEMENEYKMCISEDAPNPMDYCTYSLVKTRERVRALLDNTDHEGTPQDPYVFGGVYENTPSPMTAVDLEKYRDERSVANYVLKALEFMYRHTLANEKNRALVQDCYAHREMLCKLIPNAKSHTDAGYDDNTLLMSELCAEIKKMKADFQVDKGLGVSLGCTNSIMLAALSEEERKVLHHISQIHRVATGASPMSYNSASEAFRAILKVPQATLGTFTQHQQLHGFRLLLQFVRETNREGDSKEFTWDTMCEFCISYVVMRYIAGSRYSSTKHPTTLSQYGVLLMKTIEHDHKTCPVDNVSEEDIKALDEFTAPDLFGGEKKEGEYWITLYDVNAPGAVSSDENAAVAALCWAEWFRAYVNRGHCAKQQCAGVLLRAGPSLEINSPGSSYTRSHVVLAAELMGYKPCARPMLRHGGAADVSHTWYVSKSWESDAHVPASERVDDTNRNKIVDAYAKTQNASELIIGTILKPSTPKPSPSSTPGALGPETPKSNLAGLQITKIHNKQEEIDALQIRQVSPRVPVACGDSQRLRPR